MDIKTVDKHIAEFRKKFTSSDPKHVTYMNGGGNIPNMKYVVTKAGYQDIFDHLKSKGFYKTKGYDPKPHTWDKGHSAERMYSYTDPVHHKDGISVHVTNEHGGDNHVHFKHWEKLKEETISILEETAPQQIIDLAPLFEKISNNLKSTSVQFKTRNPKLSEMYNHYFNIFNHLVAQSKLNRTERVVEDFKNNMDSDAIKFITESEILSDEETKYVTEKLAALGINI